MLRLDAYELAGRLFAVESHDEWLRFAWEKYIRSLRYAKRSDEKPGETDVVISLRASSSFQIPPKTASSSFKDGILYRDGTKLLLVVNGVGIETDSRNRGFICASFPRSQHELKPEAVAESMSYISATALRNCDLYELHAGGVIEPKTETGFLLIGKSGSGKSSLTVRLAVSGWNYLSDDMVVLKRTTSETEAFALRRTFALTPDSIAASRLHEIQGAVGMPAKRDPSKLKVKPWIAFPEQYSTSCVPRYLCFVEIAASPTSAVETISQSKAMTRLVEYCAWTGHDNFAARDVINTIGNLVRQCDSIVFSAGRDVFENPQLSAKMLESLIGKECDGNF